jgi:hypothetical protein
LQCKMKCPLWARSGLMHCNKKKDRLAAVSPKSDQCYDQAARSVRAASNNRLRSRSPCAADLSMRWASRLRLIVSCCRGGGDTHASSSISLNSATVLSSKYAGVPWCINSSQFFHDFFLTDLGTLSGDYSLSPSGRQIRR